MPLTHCVLVRFWMGPYSGCFVEQTGYSRYRVLLNKTHDDLFIPSSITTQPLLPESEPTEAPGLLQLRNKYLIVPSRNGLMIIDRHRAHVKVLYEKYAASTANAVMESLGDFGGVEGEEGGEAVGGVGRVGEGEEIAEK